MLRPLFRARDERGCSVGVVPVRSDASLDFEAYEHMLFDGLQQVDLVVATHASNLTGDVYDVARMARLAHEAGALFVLDAAQTAGAIPMDMGALGVDVLCFTGHKALLGPQGTGGMCVADGVEVPRLLEGGSGIQQTRPPATHHARAHGGWHAQRAWSGRAGGGDRLSPGHRHAVATHVQALTERFEAGVRKLPGARVYGGSGGVGRTGIVALNVASWTPRP